MKTRIADSECSPRPRRRGSGAQSSCTIRPGFTLIELVMVLIILAILATAALNMVEVQVDQTRFETTQGTLNNIEAAVMGPPDARANDGSRIVSGFVADVGRPLRSLEELYLAPNVSIVPGFTTKSPVGDPKVVVHGGWNGPYLTLPVGATAAVDGWGNAFNLFSKNGLSPPSAEPMAEDRTVAILRSNGRDGTADPADDGYDRDLLLIFDATNDAAATAGVVTALQIQNRWKQSVTVRVYYNDVNTDPDVNNGGHIVVRVYGPHETDPATGAVEIGTVDEKVIDLMSDPPPVAVTFDDLVVGPRVIRAYQRSSAPMTPDEDLSASRPISTARSITISPETQSLNLILK